MYRRRVPSKTDIITSFMNRFLDHKARYTFEDDSLTVHCMEDEPMDFVDDLTQLMVDIVESRAESQNQKRIDSLLMIISEEIERLRDFTH